MAGDRARPSARDKPTPPAEPERVKQRIADLVAERDRAEARRRDLTDEIRASLRLAHDLGVSWSELAVLAGYRNGENARVQAYRRNDRAPTPAREHPEGSYSIREAAAALGITPQAVYDRIKAGRLTVAVDRPRGRRVYLPEGTTPIP